MGETDANAKYVYGVVRASTAKAVDARGIDDRPVEVVSLDEVGALTSEVPDGDLEAGRDELLAHSRALEGAFESGVVLPMRFGIVMDGDDAVRERLLEPHREELAAQLDELDGKVEVNIKGIYDEAAILREVVTEERDIAKLRELISGKPEDATYPERIQLGELISAALERKRESDSVAIVDRLAEHATAIDEGAPVHERMAVSCSFLVERERLEEFDRTLDALAEEQGGRIRFKYTGPLPPHSFVELSLEG